ncbi:outer membrane protein [Rhizobiales bacterium GAS191]|jgi:outer membrane protein|nr:outer membrane protein [Rhizobiales bacterium GAS113]SEE10012.1 outer membrane protein [Rhizobiales bacterium GAS191]SEE44408.1 outer membrane protein [Rhizobiales bacterium GAS188]
MLLKRGLAGVAAAAVLVLVTQQARAETLDTALVKAYGNNPQLNAQRAGVRATDEGVSKAQAGYRPKLTASAEIGALTSNLRSPNPLFGNSVTQPRTIVTHIGSVPRGAQAQLSQTLFDSGATSNTVRQAESLVLAARETLRNTEETVLFTAAQAYMNVLRDTATLDLQKSNVDVLEEQLRQTRDRFNVGEVTRTDVAQAESRLEGAHSQVSAAQATLKADIGTYRQIIGVEPKTLAPGRPIDRLLPPTIDGALKLAFSENPAIVSAFHNVDAAELAVKIAEAALGPNVALQAQVQGQNDFRTSNDQFLSAQVTATLTVPIYQGGAEYAVIRQAKETLGQQRLLADQVRDQVRQLVVAAWGNLDASKAQILAAQAQISASEVALNGVREEAKVGQRTTLDVLNAQQDLLNARVALVSAQHDRVVNSYQLLQGIGRLTLDFVSPRSEKYDPGTHYQQVRDLWWGTSVPNGH